jgi:hypothetical protein
MTRAPRRTPPAPDRARAAARADGLPPWVGVPAGPTQGLSAPATTVRSVPLSVSRNLRNLQGLAREAVPIPASP